MRYIWSIVFVTVIASADINIIATNACNFDTINHQSIKDLFMKKTKYHNHIHIEVLDNNQYYKEFISKYLHKTATRMRVYWTRMIFTGSKKPPHKVSDIDLKHPKHTYGCTISYTKLQDIKGWKILNVIP